MIYDVVRYTELVTRAQFDPGFRCGTPYDLSPRRCPGTLEGEPDWRPLNCATGLYGPPSGGAASLSKTGEIDVTRDFWCEILFRPGIRGDNKLHLISQLTVANGYQGGFTASWDAPEGKFDLDLYDGGSTVARAISTQKMTVLYEYPYHVVVSSTASGSDGGIWVWGIPVTKVLSGAGSVAAHGGITGCGFLTHSVAVDDVSTGTICVARLWYGVPTNEDVIALAGAAIEMVRC